MSRVLPLAAILALKLCAAFAGELPLPDPDATFPDLDMDEVRLGQLLFYDPVLSGNKTVACATCHHPRFGTSDGLSLGMGDGGIGIGPDRRPDPKNYPEERIARNAPALFNLGATEFNRFFHDGRLEADPSRPSGIRTPLEDDMVSGFDSALAAQAMFPVLSPDEMAGHYSENEVSKAVRLGLLSQPGGAWDKIAARVEDIPGYRGMFDTVIGPDMPVHFTDIANAIAAFISHEWRADDSPFDRYLRNAEPLGADAVEGMSLFYGKAGCAVCHAGQFQTDHSFHAIAMPQIGPGKKARFEEHHRDVGRMRVTGKSEDAYRFLTPPLRNVTRTGPYGHDGAYATLESVIRHHLDPVKALLSYDPGQAVFVPIEDAMDFPVLADAKELDAIASANELEPVSLSDAEVAALLAFLAALTDETSLAGRLGIPERVPSGLPIDR